MVNFQTINSNIFLNEYWQKKPLVIRRALPDFINPLTGDELAGLSLEDEVESRLVFETPGIAPFWKLKPGPLCETDFEKLPKTHWTLLVQGVDRLLPEVASLFDHFNFLPHWRIDDVMVSYAVKQGSVGPHFDNYDVFLYQASGRRKWSLTTQNCDTGNCLKDVPLRIMDKFNMEEEYILEPGDMLYLPPHVGHHGVALSDDCMTYSFGYRSYQGQELWDNFGDYLSEHDSFTDLYRDPIWTDDTPALIPTNAWKNARQLMKQILANDQHLKTWFGCFATSIDQQAEQQLPIPLEENELCELPGFINMLHNCTGLTRDSTCRFAYLEDVLQLFINGCKWNIDGVAPELVKYIANQRIIEKQKFLIFLGQEDNEIFLYELWKLQWLQLI